MAINTEREFLTAILALDTITDEIKEATQARLTKLDERNEKRKNTLSKEQLENLPIMDSIYRELVENGSAVASEIAQALTTPDKPISTQKVSSLCRKMVEAGRLTVTEVKSKKGTVKQYTAVITEE